MKIRPAMMLCGAVLIAVVPAWADRIPYPGSAKESPNTQISVKVTGNSGLKLNAPANGGFLADPAPGVLRIGSFEAVRAFDVWDSKSFLALNTVFPSSSAMSIHVGSLSSTRSYEFVSTISHAETASFILRDGERGRIRLWDRHTDTAKDSPTPVPEPGSLSFLLLGLAGAGFLPRQRG
jgi:hypothetical protein